jgi:hypothetical protein
MMETDELAPATANAEEIRLARLGPGRLPITRLSNGSLFYEVYVLVL